MVLVECSAAVCLCCEIGHSKSVSLYLFPTSVFLSSLSAVPSPTTSTLLNCIQCSCFPLLVFCASQTLLWIRFNTWLTILFPLHLSSSVTRKHSPPLPPPSFCCLLAKEVSGSLGRGMDKNLLWLVLFDSFLPNSFPTNGLCPLKHFGLLLLFFLVGGTDRGGENHYSEQQVCFALSL